MRRLVVAVVGLLTLMAIMFDATAEANLIVNGGFENGVGTNFDTGQTIDGWSLSGNVGRVDASGGPRFDGDFSAAFNFGNMPSDGILSQSFPTVADVTYLLSFTHGMNGALNTQTLDIQLDGAGGVGSLIDTSIESIPSFISFLSF